MKVTYKDAAKARIPISDLKRGQGFRDEDGDIAIMADHDRGGYRSALVIGRQDSPVSYHGPFLYSYPVDQEVTPVDIEVIVRS